MKKKLAKYFEKYDAKFWEAKFQNSDACVVRVKSPNEAVSDKLFSQMV